MSIWKCFKMAIASILSNKMRSILTMLGIIIGITAVIALVSLMSGMTNEVSDAFNEIGIDSIMVTVMDRSETKELPYEDVNDLVEEHSSVFRGFSPTVAMNVTIKNGNDSISTAATGVNEQYISLKELNLDYGRELTYIDIEKKQKVCVIGTYIANEVFGGDALGKTLKVSGVPYEVVGILEEKDDSTSGSNDDIIYIPYTVALQARHNSKISNYVIYAKNQDIVDTAKHFVEELCEKDIGDSDYYKITAMKTVADQVSGILDKMEYMLIAIAAISLVVAGIGIMNIMLVSVTERTREIGIRKSLGAKQKDILTQFVIEAGMLSCIGGVIGIIVGSLLAIGAGKLLDMAIMPTANSIIVSFTVSAMIGVFFGFMPARKAAALNPIDALRYD
ncbi:MAG: ABC transporter permease [Clostridia bacterium]|nr:ABC transporter permease [Clostridia bacterium]MBQ6558124.1 ABC transporter permease [Clostridia bacterium]MBQ9599869.1 ABC transporter permease [Clostridia bacterium]